MRVQCFHFWHFYNILHTPSGRSSDILKHFYDEWKEFFLQSHLVEMISYDFPYSGPLQPDATHVVVGYLNDLLQTEHSRVCRRGQFIH